MFSLTANLSYDTSPLFRVRAIRSILTKVRPGEKYIRSMGRIIMDEARMPTKAWSINTIEGRDCLVFRFKNLDPIKDRRTIYIKDNTLNRKIDT